MTADEALQAEKVDTPQGVIEATLVYGPKHQDPWRLAGLRRLQGYPTFPAKDGSHLVLLLDASGAKLYGLKVGIVEAILDPPPLEGETIVPYNPSEGRLVVVLPDLTQATEVAVETMSGESRGRWPLEKVAVVEPAKDFETKGANQVRLEQLLRSGEVVLAPAGALPVAEQTVDLTFIGAGYDTDQQFQSDSQRFSNELVKYEPFASRSYQLVFHRINNQIDLGCQYLPANPRLILCDEAKVWQAVNSAGAPADVVVVIVNNPNYGGSATSVVTAYNGQQGPAVFVHELGHVLGHLVDEYVIFGQGPLGGIQRNCSPQPGPVAAWEGLAGSDLPQGCLYQNWYRSTASSIMRELKAVYFNPVSQRILEGEINYYARPAITMVDLDHDGDMDFIDWRLMLNHFGTEYCLMSVAGGCLVDLNDWRLMWWFWGE